MYNNKASPGVLFYRPFCRAVVFNPRVACGPPNHSLWPENLFSVNFL